jgi:hypothetical protein
LYTFRFKNKEVDFEYLCEMEYKRIILLMKEVEDEFGVDLKKYKDLRHKFLDVANFVKKLPEARGDFLEYKKRLDDK